MQTTKALLLNDTSTEGHHGCDIVIQNIKTLCSLNNIEVTKAVPANVNAAMSDDVMSLLPSLDCIIVNGEGTLHHSQPRAQRLMEFVELSKKHNSLPIFLINSTYEANSDDIAKKMSLFDKIYVREGKSQNELRQIGIESQVVPDLSFYKRFVFSEKIKRNQIGLTDSVFASKSKLLYDFAKKHGLVYLPALRHPKNWGKDIGQLARAWKYKILHNGIFVLVSCGVSLPEQHARSKYFSNSYEDYIEKIAKLNLLIAGRYHSLCFAIKTQTPFIAISSNTFKMESMLEDVGIGTNRVISIDEIHPQNLPEFLHFSNDEKILIQHYSDSAIGKIETMFQEISDHLKRVEN